MEEFIEYDILKDCWEDPPPKIHSTYNSQKTEGKAYKCIEGNKKENDLYDINNNKKAITINKGDRHPSSILPNFACANEVVVEEHENVYIFNDKKATYNPQKTEGKPYIHGGRLNADLYSDKIENIPTINKGDRHPTSILPDLEEHENVYIFNDKKATYNT
jgi:predicted HTH transcriptional regulator